MAEQKISDYFDKDMKEPPQVKGGIPQGWSALSKLAWSLDTWIDKNCVRIPNGCVGNDCLYLPQNVPKLPTNLSLARSAKRDKIVAQWKAPNGKWITTNALKIHCITPENWQTVCSALIHASHTCKCPLCFNVLNWKDPHLTCEPAKTNYSRDYCLLQTCQHSPRCLIETVDAILACNSTNQYYLRAEYLK